MAKKEESTEIAAKTEYAVAVINYAEDAGGGFDEANANSYAVPFLQILQSGSPQCKKSDGAYIKGAEEGMFYNTVTQEVLDGEKGILVIPCHYTQRFNEWAIRESGGGFIKEHLPGDSPATTKDEKGRDIAANGHAIVDTRNHYLLIMAEDGTVSPALASFTSTQVKKSKQWMSKMQGIKVKTAQGFVSAPMFSRIYRLTTVPEANEKGSWFGYKIELAGTVEDPAVYNEAKAFREAIRSGAAKATQPNGEADDQAEAGSKPESF